MDLPIKFKKTCGDCSECCKGHLHGEVYGHKFTKGVPCHYHDNGCSIYENRPESPCKTYQCFWLKDEKFKVPMWLRPDKSGVIATVERLGKSETYTIILTDTQKGMSVQALAWFVQLALQNRFNLTFRIGDSINYIGASDIDENLLVKKFFPN